MAQTSGATEAVAPFSPVRPAHDPDHEQRTAAAIERALRQIPFYLRRGHSLPTQGAPLEDVLRRLPLLFKKDIRATLPKQWVSADRTMRVWPA